MLVMLVVVVVVVMMMEVARISATTSGGRSAGGGGCGGITPRLLVISAAGDIDELSVAIRTRHDEGSAPEKPPAVSVNYEVALGRLR